MTETNLWIAAATAASMAAALLTRVLRRRRAAGRVGPGAGPDPERERTARARQRLVGVLVLSAFGVETDDIVRRIDATKADEPATPAATR